MTKTSEAVLLKRFGKQLATIRRQHDLTQAQLAERVDMSVVAIAYLETGKRWARIGTLQKISEALGVSLTELFDFS